MRAGIKNTYTFDLGIPGWAEKYPKETILLGKPIPESTVKFIPKSEFKKKKLSWEEFVKKANKPGVVVIDTRDAIQKGFLSRANRKGLTPEMQSNLEVYRNKSKEMITKLGGKRKVRSLPFEQIIRFVLHNKRYKMQPLLMFDQVGKQVRWLMYRLENNGFNNYYFLDKGAVGVVGEQMYK